MVHFNPDKFFKQNIQLQLPLNWPLAIDPTATNHSQFLSP
jgi:hypothetical protein